MSLPLFHHNIFKKPQFYISNYESTTATTEKNSIIIEFKNYLPLRIYIQGARLLCDAMRQIQRRLYETRNIYSICVGRQLYDTPPPCTPLPRLLAKVLISMYLANCVQRQLHSTYSTRGRERERM